MNPRRRYGNHNVSWYEIHRGNYIYFIINTLLLLGGLRYIVEIIMHDGIRVNIIYYILAWPVSLREETRCDWRLLLRGMLPEPANAVPQDSYLLNLRDRTHAWELW
jgi:hypothetical protein